MLDALTMVAYDTLSLIKFNISSFLIKVDTSCLIKVDRHHQPWYHASSNTITIDINLDQPWWSVNSSSGMIHQPRTTLISSISKIAVNTVKSSRKRPKHRNDYFNHALYLNEVRNPSRRICNNSHSNITSWDVSQVTSWLRHRAIKFRSRPMPQMRCPRFLKVDHEKPLFKI